MSVQYVCSTKALGTLTLSKQGSESKMLTPLKVTHSTTRKWSSTFLCKHETALDSKRKNAYILLKIGLKWSQWSRLPRPCMILLLLLIPLIRLILLVLLRRLRWPWRSQWSWRWGRRWRWSRPWLGSVLGAKVGH